MKPLDIIKAKFEIIYPPEKDVRLRRFQYAGYKCEICGGMKLLQLHHVISGGIRRSFFERLFSVSCLCYDCHQGKGKTEALSRCRKEVQDILLKDFTEEETKIILAITQIY